MHLRNSGGYYHSFIRHKRISIGFFELKIIKVTNALKWKPYKIYIVVNLIGIIYCPKFKIVKYNQLAKVQKYWTYYFINEIIVTMDKKMWGVNP